MFETVVRCDEGVKRDSVTDEPLCCAQTMILFVESGRFLPMPAVLVVSVGPACGFFVPWCVPQLFRPMIHYYV